MTTQTEMAFRPVDSLANRLLLIRRELGLSQREAAMRCGVGFGSWQSWEKGASPRNALRDLIKVCEQLRIDRDWLMFGGPLRPENIEPLPPAPAARQLRDIPLGMSDDHERELTHAEILAFRKRVPLSPTDQAELILLSAAPAAWRAAA